MTVTLTITAADGATHQVALPAPNVVSSSGWPTAATTGYGSTVLTPSSLKSFSVPGTYSGLHFTGGPFEVTASNITFENCLFDGLAASAPFQIDIAQALTGVVFDHCTVVGNGTAATGASVYGWFIRGAADVTISNCDASQHGHTIAITNGRTLKVLNNYFHDLNSGPGTHYECIYYGGQRPLSTTFTLDIEGNSMSSNQNTAVIYFSTDFGYLNNITVNNNLLVSSVHGSYTLYVDGSQGSPPSSVTNVSITNNAIGKGQYGYKALNAGHSSPFQVTWSGNYDYITKAPV